ncbi:MAG: nucleotidyltransferase family protein [Candidatus Moranbacteria bacterium]|nr:nucleotidyltransferase family protein [Candidatus Moranbacteria bacterium]
MQIVILAAGRGTHMSDLTNSVPKPMLEINGKPILAYKLEALPPEIDEVIFVIGYLGNQIQEYFGNFYAGKKISYVVQAELNGTGGAMQLVKDLVENDFLVMMGDDLYMQKDIVNLIKHNLAMLTCELENPSQFGIVSVDESGKLLEIAERKNIIGFGLVNTGLYKLNKSFFDFALVPIGKGEFGLPQTLATMTDQYDVMIEKATNWFPIGNPTDLENASAVISKFI